MTAWKIYCNGKQPEDSYKLVYANIRMKLNHTGKATLKMCTENTGKEVFDDADSELFSPGASIRIDTGEKDKQKTLFEGFILEIGIKIDKGACPLIVMECRDKIERRESGTSPVLTVTYGKELLSFDGGGCDRETVANTKKYRGKFSFQGSAEAVPGCVIEIKGLGKRFSGNKFIGAVTHTLENDEWITEAGIGIPAVILCDENKNEVIMNSDGITLSSAKDISMSAKGRISLSAPAIDISAKADLYAKGMNVKVEADVGATVKGHATAELSASGQTTVKGAMVMIN